VRRHTHTVWANIWQVGRAFFAKEVVMPYLRFRMWRSSYTGPTWSSVQTSSGKFRGLWISHAGGGGMPPDVVIYYLHGGGFVWGSTHFYLEYLLLFCALLRDEAGFRCPAVFALEYSLVPENVWPAQLAETVDGYRYVISRAARGNVVLAGDSAGAALALGLLLFLRGRETPAFAALVSPWTRLSGGYGDSRGDYLEESRLREVAGVYAAGEDLHAPLLAPAECVDDSWWRESLPAAGMAMYWGSREVLRPGIVELVARLERVAKIVARESDEVHCWPVAAVFLAAEPKERESALRVMCRDIAQALRGCG
jgi:acetyl esterase/lipase